MRHSPLLLWNLHERTRMVLCCQKLSWTTEQLSFITADFAHICYKGISSPPVLVPVPMCTPAHASRKKTGLREVKILSAGLPFTASTELWGRGKSPQAKPAKCSWIRTNTNSSSPTLALPHKTWISHLAAVWQISDWLCWGGFTVHILVCSLQAQFPENSWEVSRRGLWTILVKAILMEPMTELIISLSVCFSIKNQRVENLT